MTFETVKININVNAGFKTHFIKSEFKFLDSELKELRSGSNYPHLDILYIEFLAFSIDMIF